MTAPGGEAGPGWLAVIDMQRVFAEPDSPWRAPRFGQITRRVAALASLFAPRVTWTRFIAPDRPQGGWADYYRQWPFALQPPGARLYELADGIGAPGGATLDTTTFSKWGPQLAGLAGPGGRLVLAGVSTDCCVLCTALAAADDGIRVQVVGDACAGATDTSHVQALDIMRLYGPLIEVVSSADLLGPGGAGPGQDAGD